MLHWVIAVAFVIGLLIWLYLWLADNIYSLRLWIRDARRSRATAVSGVIFLGALFLALHAHFDTHARVWTIFWSVICGLGGLGATLIPVIRENRRDKRILELLKRVDGHPDNEQPPMSNTR